MKLINIRKNHNPGKLVFLLIFISLCLIFAFNATTTTSYALPKPYQDKIDEAKKKREEEKKKKEEEDKKKKEEEDKNKEEEKKEEEKKDDRRHDKKSEPDVRYLIPIIPQTDLIPRIKIIETSLLDSSGSQRTHFQNYGTASLKLKYRVTEYDGFDNVSIDVTVYDSGGRFIARDSQINPLRIGDTVTQIFHDVVPLYSVGTGGFRVSVSVKVEGRRETSSVSGWIGREFDRGSIRIIDAYLTNDNSWSYNYWRNPAQGFIAGDQYRLVVEYEVYKSLDEDIDFEYKLTTGYYGNHIIDSGRFWDRARSGRQTVYRRGWFPYYLPNDHCRVRLEITAYYAGDSDISTSYYDVYSEDYFDSTNYGYYWQSSSPRNPVFRIGPVYFAGDGEPIKYRSFFTPNENVNVVIYYEHNRLPYDLMGERAFVDYIIYDPFGNLFLKGKSDFTPLRKDKRKLLLIKSRQLELGRYEVDLSLKIGSNTGTYKSYFYVNDKQTDQPLFEQPRSDNLRVQTRGDFVEYQIDDNIILNLPSFWRVEIGYEDGDPPLIFRPDEFITGQALIFEFDDPQVTLEDAIIEYEKREKESTSIGAFSENYEQVIDGNRFTSRIYNGKIYSKGQFLEEKVEDVKIGIVYHVYHEDESTVLYVIRMVAPILSYVELNELAMNFSKQIKYVN